RSRPAVVVFARAPVAGHVKTRLASRLGAAGAARLQARLTANAVDTALRAQIGVVELHGAPARHQFLRLLGSRARIAVRPQKGKDLGERMRNAFERVLRRHRPVVLIGADCPALTPGDLRRAVRLLRGGADVVLAPAEDGGYALVGLRRVRPRLFEDIAWGGAEVLAQTLRRAGEARLAPRALRTVWDVDRPPDLERLRALRFRAGARRAARR